MLIVLVLLHSFVTTMSLVRLSLELFEHVIVLVRDSTVVGDSATVTVKSVKFFNLLTGTALPDCL